MRYEPCAGLNSNTAGFDTPAQGMVCIIRKTDGIQSIQLGSMILSRIFSRTSNDCMVKKV